MNEVKTSKAEPIRTKSTAIILAILFGPFAWLYTHKKNGAKFWLAMGIGFIITINLIFLDIMILVIAIAWFYLFAMYVWSIVDNAMKPNSFYENYPK